MEKKLLIPASYLEDFELNYKGAREIVALANSDAGRTKLIEEWTKSGIDSLVFDREKGYPDGSIDLLLLKEDKKFQSDSNRLKKLIAVFSKKRLETTLESAKFEYDQVMSQMKKVRNYVILEYPSATAFLMDYHQQLGGQPGTYTRAMNVGLLFCTNPPIAPPTDPYPEDGISEDFFVVGFLLAVVIIVLFGVIIA
jgi:hypothetical protein